MPATLLGGGCARNSDHNSISQLLQSLPRRSEVKVSVFGK